MLDGVLLVSQEKRQPAEHQQEPADVALVVQLPVAFRRLCVAAREHVMALPLHTSEAWKYAFAIAAAVAELLRELERALDVVVRGDVVAKPAVAPRSPLQDVRAKHVARQTRTLGDRQRLVEQCDRGRARSRACTDRPRAGRGRRRDRDPRSRHARRARVLAAAASIASFAWPTSCRARLRRSASEARADRAAVPSTLDRISRYASTASS